jgi:hypothetical protein
VTIRELFVRLGVDADTEEVESFSSKLASTKTQMKAAVAAGGAVVAAIGGVTAAAAGAAFEVAQYSRRLLKNAEIAQTSVEDYQVLVGALEEQGVEADVAKDSINELSVRMQEAANGAGPAAGKFEELGVSIKNADGSLRDANDVFRESIRKLGQIENKSKRAALAEKIFGGEFQKLNPIISEGVDSIEEYREKAESFGLLLSEETAQQAKEFRNELGFLRKVFMAIVRELGAEVIPVFDKVVQAVKAWVKANRDVISTGIDKFAFALGEMFDFLLASLAPFDGVLELFVDNMQKVAAVMGGVLLTALGAAAYMLVTTWIPAAWSAVAPFLPLIAAAAAASVVVWELINVFYEGESALLGWLDQFEALQPAVAWIRDNLKLVAGALAVVGAAVAAYFFPFWAAGLAIAGVVADLVNVLSGGDSVIVSFIEKFAIGRQIIDGLNAVISAMVEYFWAVVEVFEAILPTWGQFKVLATAALTPVIGYFKILIRWFKLAGRVLKFTFRVAFTVVKNIATTTYELLAAGLRMFAALAAPVFNAVWRAFLPVANGIRSVWETVIGFVLDKIEALSAGFDYIRQQVADLVGIELSDKEQKVEQKTTSQPSGFDPIESSGSNKAASAQQKVGQRAASGTFGGSGAGSGAGQGPGLGGASSAPQKVEAKTEIGEINIEGSDSPEETRDLVRDEIEDYTEERARSYMEQKKGQEAGERAGGSS